MRLVPRQHDYLGRLARPSVAFRGLATAATLKFTFDRARLGKCRSFNAAAQLQGRVHRGHVEFVDRALAALRADS